MNGSKTLDGLPARLHSDEGQTAGVAAPGLQGLLLSPAPDKLQRPLASVPGGVVDKGEIRLPEDNPDRWPAGRELDVISNK
jgi:hypothetical protein